MRSFHNSQNIQSIMTKASLASQFMDMFDASMLETSLLRKRELHTQDNLYQTQKKIKASTINNSLTMPSALQMTGLNPMLYNANYQFNPLLATLGGDQTYGLQTDLARASQLQNLALVKHQKEALLSLQPLSFPTMSNSQLYVKQEYIKQEELPTSQGSPNSYPFKSVLSDNYSNNENSPVSSELQVPAIEMTEPALVDFTREFPDWDLATIFGFIRSGKSREIFEKEKQCKIERKLRKKKLRMANKEKGITIQQKTVKGKRMTGKVQETD